MPFVAPTSAFATSDSAIVIHPSRRPTPLLALISWWICLRRTLSAFVHLVSLAADSGRRHAVMVHTAILIIQAGPFSTPRLMPSVHGWPGFHPCSVWTTCPDATPCAVAAERE